MGVAADHWARVMDEAERIAGFGVWEWDVTSGRVAWSDQLHRIYGLEPGEFAGTVDDFVSRLHPDDRERVWASISRAVEALESFVFEERIVRADGEERVLLSQGHVIADAAGRAATLVGVCHDVTERVEAARALGHSERRMRAIIDNSPSIVAVKDLSGRYLMANAETGRVVGMSPDQLVGSKCVDLFPAALAEQILAADRRAAAEGEPVYDEAILVRNGDPRTYSTVTFPLPDSSGRPIETCTIGTDVTERRVRESERRERIEWEGRISSALSEDRMRVVAQPVFDLATGAQFSSELLVRMRAPGGDELRPAEFLPAAERFGLIQAIDVWMVRRALACASPTRQVNLSAVSICDPAAREAIVGSLVAAGDAAREIVFEITETAAATHVEAARAFAADVSALGCGLALDDFGIGFGSFTYLRMLPLSYLKVDISFVRGLLDSDDDRRVVQSIIAVAERFGLRTIAEGVEDEATLGLLRELGADYAQGFHLGRPAPLEP
jgi:PAS domain S-box-containing protein